MVAVALICCNKGLNTKIRQSTRRGTINLLQKIKLKVLITYLTRKSIHIFLFVDFLYIILIFYF